MDRPKWRKLLKQLKPGDIIIFDSVSRMARDAEEGFEEYQKLYASGIELIFLQEPHINTEVYRRALQVCIPKTGTKVDVILEAVEKYLMLLAKEQIIGRDHRQAGHCGKFALTICNKYGKGSHKMKKTEEEK